MLNLTHLKPLNWTEQIKNQMQMPLRYAFALITFCIAFWSCHCQPSLYSPSLVKYCTIWFPFNSNIIHWPSILLPTTTTPLPTHTPPHPPSELIHWCFTTLKDHWGNLFLILSSSLMHGPSWYSHFQLIPPTLCLVTFNNPMNWYGLSGFERTLLMDIKWSHTTLREFINSLRVPEVWCWSKCTSNHYPVWFKSNLYATSCRGN